MLIREVLKMTESKKIAEIARDHLVIGEKRTRIALRAAGCFTLNGKRGWKSKPNNEIALNKSIYDFVPPKPTARTLEVTQESDKMSSNGSTLNVYGKNKKSKPKQPNKSEKDLEPITLVNGETKIPERNRTSFDIDTQVHKDLKKYCVDSSEKWAYRVVEKAIVEYMKNHPIS